MKQTIGHLGQIFTLFCGIIFALIILMQSGIASLSAPLVVLLGMISTAIFIALILRFLPEGRYFLCGLFGLRFLLAMVSTLILRPQPVQDFKTMYDAAVLLSQGDHSYLDLTYFFHWAYQSAFVAYEAVVIRIFGEGLLPLQLLNALFMSGIVCLVYLIGKRFLPNKIAMTIALLYAVYPAPLVLAGVLTNQHLCTFLLYLSIWILIREDELSFSSAIIAGIVIALGNAIRPIGVVLILAFILSGLLRTLVTQRAKLLPAMLPWFSVAVSYFLAFTLLSSVIIWTDVNPHGLSNNQPMWKFLVGLNHETSGRWNRDDYEMYGLLPTEEGADAMTDEVLNRLSEGPVALGELALSKSSIMWGSYEDFYWGFHSQSSEDALFDTISWKAVQYGLAQLDKGLYLLIFAFALLGLLHLFRSGIKNTSTLLLTFLFCGYYAVHLIVEVQPRYRYFIMPTIFLLAGIGLHTLYSLRKERLVASNTYN